MLWKLFEMKSSRTSLLRRRQCSTAKTRGKILKNVTFQRCLSSVTESLHIIPKAKLEMLFGPYHHLEANIKYVSIRRQHDIKHNIIYAHNVTQYQIYILQLFCCDLEKSGVRSYIQDQRFPTFLYLRTIYPFWNFSRTAWFNKLFFFFCLSKNKMHAHNVTITNPMPSIFIKIK